MDLERKHSIFSVLLHTFVGILLGYVSLLLEKAIIAAPVAIIVLIVLGFITNKVVGKKKRSWWLSNGVVIYLFMWFLSWVIFFNLL